ncbi:MAG: class I SAM-dependent methyltransferase [Fibrobacterota bacterium]
MEAVLFAEMAAMEERHWWFAARRRVLLTLLARNLLPSPSVCVCDLGCGCGATLMRLQPLYDACGMEAAPEALAFCTQKGLKVRKGSLPDDVTYPDSSFDACLMLDVLEHIEKDGEAVMAARRLLKPGGVLLATVPAFPSLYSGRDTFHGHKRRYTHAAFQALFPADSFKVMKLTFFNSFLFGPAALTRLLRKWSGRNTPGPDLSIPPAPLNALLGWFFALERFPLTLGGFPAGLSLLCMVRKK